MISTYRDDEDRFYLFISEELFDNIEIDCDGITIRCAPDTLNYLRQINDCD